MSAPGTDPSAVCAQQALQNTSAPKRQGTQTQTSLANANAIGCSKQEV